MGAERWSPCVLRSLQPGLRRGECLVSSVSCRTERTEASLLRASVGKRLTKCESLTPSGERNMSGSHLKHKRDQVFPRLVKRSPRGQWRGHAVNEQDICHRAAQWGDDSWGQTTEKRVVQVRNTAPSLYDLFLNEYTKITIMMHLSLKHLSRAETEALPFGLFYSSMKKQTGVFN